jgi:hypothetical protein
MASFSHTQKKGRANVGEMLTPKKDAEVSKK